MYRRATDRSDKSLRKRTFKIVRSVRYRFHLNTVLTRARAREHVGSRRVHTNECYEITKNEKKQIELPHNTGPVGGGSSIALALTCFCCD